MTTTINDRLYNQIEIVYNILQIVPSDQGKLLYFKSVNSIQINEFEHVQDTLQLYDDITHVHLTASDHTNTKLTYDSKVIITNALYNMIILMHRICCITKGGILEYNTFRHVDSATLVYNSPSIIYKILHDDYTMITNYRKVNEILREEINNFVVNDILSLVVENN